MLFDELLRVSSSKEVDDIEGGMWWTTLMKEVLGKEVRKVVKIKEECISGPTDRQWGLTGQLDVFRKNKNGNVEWDRIMVIASWKIPKWD